MPEIFESIQFRRNDIDPSQWPQLSCSAANQLALTNSSLRLDANQEIVFQGNGQLRIPGDLRLLTGDPATEKFVLLANGNVGIGESSPTTKLSVNGTLKLQQGIAVNEFSNDGNLTDNSDLTIPSEKAVKTYVDTRMTTKATLNGLVTQDFQTRNLTVAGNLEVTGTTTFRNIEQHQGDLELGNEDTDQVRIRGVVRSTHSSGTLQITNPINVTGAITATTFVGNGAGLTGLPTQWLTSGCNISYSSGNVGIGANQPGDKLEIVTSGDPNNGLTVREPGTGSVSLNLKNQKGKWRISGPRSYESGNSLSIFWNNNTAYLGPYLSIQDNGNVGIGAGSLSVKGDISFGATLSTPGRMHITGGETLYLLHKNGAIVSKAWGGNGNLTVEGDINICGRIVSTKGLSPGTNYVFNRDKDRFPLKYPTPNDAQLLFYDYGGGNWAGIGVDTSGYIWMRAGWDDANSNILLIGPDRIRATTGLYDRAYPRDANA